MTRATPILKLRALIANDEALVAHYVTQLQGEDDGYGIIDALPAPSGYPPEREALIAKLGDTIRRLQHRRHALETLTKPSPAVADARALNVAQPAPLSTHV